MPKMDNEDFKNAFRVDRSTFHFLVKHMKPLQRMDTTWRFCIPLPKRIAISLYTLGSSAEYRTVGSLFGVGRTTVGQLVLEFSKELWSIFQKDFLNVYPPTQQKVEEIVHGFERLGFPQCFGAIDGCHIEVNPPKHEAVDYYNFKGWYSTVLFASVDYRYRFTYINVGSPGRCNDSTLFENSLLKLQHEQNAIFKENSQKILGTDVPVLLIGDSAFKLSNYLMKPFPFSVSQNEREKRFNYHLSKCRIVVESAFGHLKARFRRIGKGLEVHIDNAPTIIKACCMLHNICNNHSDKINKVWIKELRNLEKRKQPQFRNTRADDDGSIIRNTLMENFCKYGNNLIFIICLKIYRLLDAIITKLFFSVLN